MTGSVDRYRAGIETLLALSPDKGELISDALAAEAPDFARLMVEFAFADIFARNGLDLRSRMFVAIGALAAQARSPTQLHWFVRAALGLGISRDEITEALMEVAVFSGFVVASDALEACRDLLADQPSGDCCPSRAAFAAR
ncbi:carboxymuconolactone decarboxylase family protein [Novosphingobium sp. Gsoil 351]|uniref:carboxymuconolactone decarboxylase family protein n=1 Tax=Novosphingobium sp. Gsoil 351 TaxID=2675225 RepID=UPI0012B4F069|nr:carboxymuconolactone decarboxylase family protein [Novosphingobium sp. Gsoil 351]QGN55372.1 carboxymuconolactone decarboxylase family protein [Novosphingobium sp. Gsoil 351]